MALRISEADQDTNPIQDNYTDQKGSYVSELEQLKRLENIRNSYPDAIAAREGLSHTNSDDIQSQEESPLVQPGLWANKVTSQDDQTIKQGMLKRFATSIKSRKKRAAAGGLILGGGLIAAILLPILMLPLKMIGLYSNITTAASKIPASIVERQTERRTTQMFATWLIRKSAGEAVTDADTSLVFCKNSSIGCSLTATRINAYFDARFDLTNIAKVDSETSTRRVTISPKNRDSIGAKARAWTINVETDLGVEGQKLSRQVNHITSNKEMKIFLRNHVNERMATKSVITRFIARKALMKRYGVTNWRAFEKTSNAIADKRASFKAAMIQNTVGKVSPEASTLLGCVTGGSTCDKLRDQIASKIDDTPTPKVLDDDGTVETPQQVEQRLKKSEAYKKAIGEVIEVPGEEKIMTRYISKQLVGKLAGGAGILGAVDMVMGAIGTIDDGALEDVIYTVRSTAYVGYTFGDTAGIATNIEKVKIGDGDSDIMQIMAEQFEGVEESPVFQAETGLLEGSSFSDGGFKRTCSDEKGKPKEVILTDSYVCPERQVVQDVTQFMNNPAGKTLGMLATIWNNSAGFVFDFLGFLGDVVFEFFRVNDAISAIFGSSMTALAEWLIGLFFDVPSLGDEARGDQNYDALSAGVWISQNEMMENGNNGGDLLGAGGRVLSNEEVATIQAEQRGLELEHFNSQSFLARMFDTNLSNSFTNQFIARVPVATFTNTANILSLPSTAIASLSGTLSPATQAQPGPLNPHNLPLYGYTSAELDSFDDPSIFTDEYCKTSSDDREASYGRLAGYPISGYTKTDPCALERMVIGNILHDMGVKDDPHSFKDPAGEYNPRSGGGARITESQLLALIKEYGLPAPKAELSPNLTMHSSPVKGYEELLKHISDEPKATWATEELLAAEKAYLDKGGDLKEYLNTAWLWFETDQGGWPDPYQINCNDDRPGSPDEVHFQCPVGNFQVSGYQAADRAMTNSFVDTFKKFYSDDELVPVMKKALENSSKAMRETWDYNNSQQNKELVAQYKDEVDGATLDDIATNRDEMLGNGRKQFMTLLLGKDPKISAALNSFAVSDSDLINALKSSSCGYGYICEGEKQALSNMIMALYKFDSARGNSAQTGSVAGARVNDSTGIASIVRGSVVEWVSTFDQGGENCGFYEYAKDYGLSECIHTGTDIQIAKGAPIYTPVSGTVRCRATDDGTGTNGGGCAKFADTMSGGAGRIEIELDNGDVLILGHIARSLVQNGQRVKAGDQVGTNGGMNNSWHVHVEYRIPDSSTVMGWRIISPENGLGGKVTGAQG